MKKMSTIVLALLLALSLCSCAVIGSQNLPTEQPAATDTPQPTQEATSEPSAAPSDTPAQLAGMGNTAGNLNNGGFVVTAEDGTIFLALKDGGILSIAPDGTQHTISDDIAYEMNLWQNRLYYVSQKYSDTEYDYTEHSGDEIISLSLDGVDRIIIGEEKPVKIDFQYNDEGGLDASTNYCGYTDLTLINGSLYYIANNAGAGSMTIHSNFDKAEAQMSWDSNQSIYRMDLDGTHVTELVKDLGNAQPHFCSDGEKLYYSTSYNNYYFSYPIVQFRSCDLEGQNDALLLDYKSAEADTGFTSEHGNMTEIVDGLFVSGGTLFVSASDSEGDFPNSRLMRVDQDAYTYVMEETYYVHATSDGDRVVYFNAPGEMKDVTDEEGVIVDEYVENAKLMLERKGDEAADAQPLLVLDKVMRSSDEFSSFRISLLGDQVYVLTDAALYRIDTATLEKTTVVELPKSEEADE